MECHGIHKKIPRRTKECFNISERNEHNHKWPKQTKQHTKIHQQARHVKKNSQTEPNKTEEQGSNTEQEITKKEEAPSKSLKKNPNNNTHMNNFICVFSLLFCFSGFFGLCWSLWFVFCSFFKITFERQHFSNFLTKKR